MILQVYFKWKLIHWILNIHVCTNGKLMLIMTIFYFSDNPLPVSREPSVQFKEIEVKQLDKSALYNMPIQGY